MYSYTFNQDEIDYYEILDSIDFLWGEELNPEIYCSYVYNIYDEIQYLLFEDDESFFLYDLMDNGTIQYSPYTTSYWSYYNVNFDYSVLYYFSPYDVYHSIDGDLYDTLDNIIVGQTDDSLLSKGTKVELVLSNGGGGNENDDEEYLNSKEGHFQDCYGLYSSSIVECDYSYYFQNFYINHVLNGLYNTHGTCGIVALVMLLGYYDTFYDNDLIPNTISYTDNNNQQQIHKIPVPNKKKKKH